MHKEVNTSGLLEKFSAIAGDTFTYDEGAIHESYASLRDNRSSLSIKALSVFGGLLATLTFLGFLALAEVYESELASMLLGVGFIAVAIYLNKMYSRLIIDTASITLYVAGVFLFVFALSLMDSHDNLAAIIVILMGLCTLYVTQNFMLSFVAAVTISSSVLSMIFTNRVFYMAHVYIGCNAVLLVYWILHEAKIIAQRNKLSKLYDPLRIALIVSFLLGLIVIGKKGIIPIVHNTVWLSTILLAPAVAYTIYQTIRALKVTSPQTKIAIYSLSVLFLVPTGLAPSILGAILVVLLCFLVNYKTGLVFGLVGLIYFISQYYYDLNLTLLVKSIILFASGVILLLFYVFLSKKFNP